MLVAALLVTSGAALAVHKDTQPAPPGFQRVTDGADHLSLAVPDTWKVVSTDQSGFSERLQSLKASNPQLGPLADFAQTSLASVTRGVLTADPVTRATLFTFSVAVPPAVANGAPLQAIVAQLQKLNLGQLDSTQVTLPLGPAVRLTVHVPVGRSSIAEVLDFLVVRTRIVIVTLASLATDPDTVLFDKIESTMQRA